VGRGGCGEVGRLKKCKCSGTNGSKSYICAVNVQALHKQIIVSSVIPRKGVGRGGVGRWGDQRNESNWECSSIKGSKSYICAEIRLNLQCNSLNCCDILSAMVFSFILCKAPTRELQEGFRVGLLSHSCSISLLHLRTLPGLLTSISSSLLVGRPSSIPNWYQSLTMPSNWCIRDLIPMGKSRSVVTRKYIS